MRHGANFAEGRRVGRRPWEPLESDRSLKVPGVGFGTPQAQGAGGSECAMRREHRRPLFCRSTFVAADCVMQVANS